ncbi:protein C3orf33 homolog isoform X6 [Phyllopteryx taeniolatus]|uniref:protein C3orf33 homolog isoform X6 n=1 Tax=Phyllopteryx taeniolatus TaxID=161469 RepID=UPI002AD4FA9B|nr:protein C3orf33 homolog isoform X6 [Phyllopteryx taeniolatus]
MHIFAKWEEAGVPEENRRKHRENIQIFDALCTTFCILLLRCCHCHNPSLVSHTEHKWRARSCWGDCNSEEHQTGVPTSPLLVKLAGVDLTAEGKLWLQRRVLPAQTVWLKLISRQDDALHCFVAHSMQGSSWGRSVNEEALYLGLARRAPVAGLSQHSRLYWRLHQRLHRAEVKAEKRRLGLWREDSQWERAVKAVRDSALFRLLCRLFGRT